MGFLDTIVLADISKKCTSIFISGSKMSLFVSKSYTGPAVLYTNFFKDILKKTWTRGLII